MGIHPLFSDGAVFAAGKPIRVFGVGRGRVTVCFAGDVRTADPGEDGKWLVEFPPRAVGGPYELRFEGDGERRVFSDVFVGRVILLHGQSNIEFTLRESVYPPEKYESCDRLRLYDPENGAAWTRCTRENAGNWSAIGYHVGIRIAEESGVAVGLIACYQGASVIQSWLPAGTLSEMGISFSPSEMHGDHFYPTFRTFNQDGYLYRNKVLPLLPFPLSDVIWYQGESNATPVEGRAYGAMLKRLIEQRRADFRDPDLPFTVVQLADCEARAGDGWSAVQDAQIRIGETVEGVRTVICRDVCETDRIHPPTKEKLADRIADLWLRDWVH